MGQIACRKKMKIDVTDVLWPPPWDVKGNSGVRKLKKEYRAKAERDRIYAEEEAKRQEWVRQFKKRLEEARKKKLEAKKKDE